MNTYIHTVYAEQDDMTFIMEVTTDGTMTWEEVVGWYYGEPDDEATMKFVGCLCAEY